MKGLKTIEGTADFLGIEKKVLIGGVDLPTGAKLLGIGITTLRKRALAGKIGYRRDGNRWIFHWADIAEYLNNFHFEAKPSQGRTSEESLPTSNFSDDAEDSIKADAKSLGLI